MNQIRYFYSAFSQEIHHFKIFHFQKTCVVRQTYLFHLHLSRFGWYLVGAPIVCWRPQVVSRFLIYSVYYVDRCFLVDTQPPLFCCKSNPIYMKTGCMNIYLHKSNRELRRCTLWYPIQITCKREYANLYNTFPNTSSLMAINLKYEM